MPITINGSGTVTGISAGGLPDGVITRPEMGYAGAVLQVVNATYSTQATSSSSTFADTGLTATITPTSASSKILIMAHIASVSKSGNTYAMFRLVRGASTISTFDIGAGNTFSTATNEIGTVSTSYLDSPATTSATTYKVTFASGNNVAGVTIHGSNTTSTITLMEIAA